MNFSLTESLTVLAKTPYTLSSLLSNLSPSWTFETEGYDGWSVHDVMGHLIHCEKAGWLSRAQFILSQENPEEWQAFDPVAHLSEGVNRPLEELLADFRWYRRQSLEKIKSWNLRKSDWTVKGNHPHFGEITLSELLATWVLHDLNHINQITRILAKQYEGEVGPWAAYLKILN